MVFLRSRVLCAAFTTLSTLLLGSAPRATAQGLSQSARQTAAPVVAKQTGPGEITVTWKAVPGATGYIIGRSVGLNGFQRFEPNYPAQTSLVDRDITPGMTHTYNVKALLPGGKASAPAVSGTITPTEGAPAPATGGSGGTGTPAAGTTGTTGTTSDSGGTGGTSGATTEKARFRVTIAGFKVLQETNDDPTQADGQRDEVYMTVGVTGLNSDPTGAKNSAIDRTFRTVTYGDTLNFPSRVRAGTSHSGGGLRSGDVFLPAINPKAGNNRLPLRVFEGELVKGGAAVAITPVLWEEDLFNLALPEWDRIVASREWRLLLPTPTRTRSSGRRGLFFTLGGLRRIAGTAGAAVNSMVNHFRQSVMDRPIGLEMENGVRVFNPRVLVLTYEEVEPLVRGAGGKAARIEIHFEDRDANTPTAPTAPKGGVPVSQLGGRYVLYVDIEKMP